MTTAWCHAVRVNAQKFTCQEVGMDTDQYYGAHPLCDEVPGSKGCLEKTWPSRYQKTGWTPCQECPWWIQMCKELDEEID